MGIAEQEHLHLLGLPRKSFHIDRPYPILFHQTVFHHLAAPGLYHIVELGVYRGLDHHLGPFFREDLHQSGQSGHHAQAPAHQGCIHLPSVPPLLPALHRLKIAVRPGRVPPDPLLGLLAAGIDDGLCRAKIHIRHPQRDHIIGPELQLPLIILGRTVLAAVDHLIKIVLHGFSPFLLPIFQAQGRVRRADGPVDISYTFLYKQKPCRSCRDTVFLFHFFNFLSFYIFRTDPLSDPFPKYYRDQKGKAASRALTP